MKKYRTAAALTAVFLAFNSVNVYASNFADINDVPWDGAKTYIKQAYNNGLMDGYEENGRRYFKANKSVTYIETVQMIYSIMNANGNNFDKNKFVSKWQNTMESNDIPSWAYNAVAYALENSILTISDLGILMRNKTTQNNARRQDVAVIFGKALSKVYDLSEYPYTYYDSDVISSVAMPYVELLNRLDLMVGDSDNRFNPKNYINRAEMAVLVSKTYKLLDNAGFYNESNHNENKNDRPKDNTSKDNTSKDNNNSNNKNDNNKVKPVSLFDLTCANEGRSIRVKITTASYIEDVYGNHYTQAISPLDGATNFESDYSASYNLYSKYSRFTGTIYRPVNADYSSGAVGRNGATTVKIYGDGVLLYTAPNIDKNTTGPVKFDIDITGVSELKIVMMGTWFNGMYGYGGTLVCMSDVMLE